MKRLCLRFICLALTGFLFPISGQSAEPILLQGKIDQQKKPEPSWYNSRDPEVLNNQILLLNQTLTETRRIVRDHEKELKETSKDLIKANGKIESLERKLKKTKRGEIVEVRDPKLELQLNTANARIESLERQVAGTRAELKRAQDAAETAALAVQTPTLTPAPVVMTPAVESQELAEMKALVRTYEKAIASLEDELEGLRVPSEPVLPLEIEVAPPPAPAVPAFDITPAARPIAPAPSLPVNTMEPRETNDLEIDPSQLIIPSTEPIVEMAPPATLDPVEPTPSEAKLVMDAEQALDSGDLGRADALFREALIYNPELVEARLGLASIAYAQNELEAASRQVEAILGDYPKQADALGLKGIIHWRAGRRQAAKKYLQEAIELDGENARLLNFMAIVQDAGGNSEAALETLNRAVTVDPDFPEAHFNLAVIEMMRPLPDREKAVKHYEQSILLGSKRDARLEERLYVER